MSVYVSESSDASSKAVSTFSAVVEPFVSLLLLLLLPLPTVTWTRSAITVHATDQMSKAIAASRSCR
jgi:hypothetical protein